MKEPTRRTLTHRMGMKVWLGPNLHDQRVPLEVVDLWSYVEIRERLEKVEAWIAAREPRWPDCLDD